MKNIIRSFVIALLSAFITAGCSNNTVISFKQDVQPIFKDNCFPCHQAGGAGEVASGLNLETYEGLIRGTKFGPVIQPGLSYASTLQVLIEHKAAEVINMPRGRRKLQNKEIEIIGNWINQGAKNN